MKEVWKDIYGFPYYQVSNIGRVKSLKGYGGVEERILKPRKDKGGYLEVNLCKNGKFYNKLIHRLVAEAFLPNDDLFKTDINHKDENKENNFVFLNDDGTVNASKSNLEWCDVAYNNSFGSRNERIAKTEINHPKKSKVVLQYSLDGVFIKKWASTQEVKRQLGFNQGNISECCNGKRQTHKGYIWRYKDSIN